MVTRKPSGKTLTDQQILDFLSQNPEFLIRHPELIESLTPPSRHSGDRVTDLQNFMLRKLQNDNAQLRDINADLIRHSRENLIAQQRIHSAVISILTALNLEDLLHVISSDLVLHLGIDVVSLCFEADDILQSGTIQSGVQILPPYAVDEMMGSRAILLRADIQGDPKLFAGSSGLVRSDALVRLYLSDESPDGLLALGSRKPDAFHAGFGGELLAFLGQMVEMALRQWLDASE